MLDFIQTLQNVRRPRLRITNNFGVQIEKDMDKKTKAVAESLLITSEGQFTEMKKDYDGKIAELVAITNEQGQVLDSHNESLAHVAEHSRKMDKDLLVTNREVEELKRQTDEDRGLVVLRFKETKDSLESYFKCLETIQSTQNEEVSSFFTEWNPI